MYSMFFFIFYLKNIEVKKRKMLDDVYLNDIPYVVIEDRFPAYYDWYAEDKGNSIIINRLPSELLFEVRNGKAMTNYDYYQTIYNARGNVKDVKIIEREYCYELVKKFYDKRLKGIDRIQIDILDVNFNYEIDKYYKNIYNRPEIRWENGR